MKKTVEITIIAAVMAAVLALIVGQAVSQDEGADTMQILLEKIRADKKLLVSVNMNLTDAEAKAFWPVYDKYQEALGKLVDRSIKLIDEYHTHYQDMSEKSAKKLIDDHLAIEADRQNLRQAYLPMFSKALPYKKVARYYQIENKIQAVVNYELARGIPLVE
jgi:hypothetical protein